MSGAPQDEEQRVSEPGGGAVGGDTASPAPVATLGGGGGNEPPVPEPSPPPAAETLKPGPVGEGAAYSAAVGSEAERVPVGPGVQTRYAGRTAVGLVREHNEDNFTIVNLETGDKRPRSELCLDPVLPGGMLYAVCDGMGGAAAGEVASQMAVDILADAMRRGGAPKDRDALARRLVSAVEEAGKRIFDEAQKERAKRGMGTTATVTVLVDKVLFVAEVGDSRAYLLRNGVLKQLTKDQSLVNQLIEAGHLTEEEAEAFEHSNIILQALGTAEAVQVDLTFVELRRGDRLMLCSDGLSGLVHADSIAEAMRTLHDPNLCCTKLIEYAEAGGGHDNITVIVVDFGGDDLVAPKETDSHGYMQYPLPLTHSETGAFGDEDETTASGGEVGALLEGGRDGAQERGGSGTLWYVIGLIALAIGAAALALTSSSSPKEEAPERPVNQVAPAEQPKAVEAVVEQAAEPAPVTVNVHTDVEGATLLVNGEVQGPLSKDERRTLALTPGAYRFEAQSGGNTVAVSVLTVREDVPTDVFLQMPTGTTDTTVGGAAAVPGEPDENDQEAVEPEPAKAAAPRTAAPRQIAVGEPSPARRKAVAPVEAAPKPAAEKPAAEKPAAEKPAAEKPAEAPKAAPPAIPDNPF
jgi:serine/threonine protein phosphatase PrpC